MMKVVAPMAGITDSEFLNKVIPYGFDVATLGGYSLDTPTIEASRKIIERGRNESTLIYPATAKRAGPGTPG